MKTKIICHKPNRSYEGFYFFILSKGNNAGKPLNDPCPNCFVVFTLTDEHKQELFWLCYGLWQAGTFRTQLVGSVIEFLRIDDLRNLVRINWMRIYDDPDSFLKAVKGLNAVLASQKVLQQQLEKLEMLKLLLIRKTLLKL